MHDHLSRKKEIIVDFYIELKLKYLSNLKICVLVINKDHIAKNIVKFNRLV